VHEKGATAMPRNSKPGGALAINVDGAAVAPTTPIFSPRAGMERILENVET
jgi:hypothetical protein